MEKDIKILRRSQTLRKQMTKEERHLWYDFLKSYPIQFRRQYPIGMYFADFFCYQANLIVELDGSQHCEPSNIEYDQQRTNYLQQRGYEVLRFSNLEVTRQFTAVCETIDTVVHARMKG